MSVYQLNRRHEPQARELAARESNCIQVRLLWNPGEDPLTVEVDDARGGLHVELSVAGERALDAFYHPFAHAA